jgi:threonylcarbamoyladenosine tRNA methylthiotransferase MtaB
MKTFAITTFGCKVNQYESQQVRQLLGQLGLTQVQFDARPDLVVVNTCCVTHTASAKSRQCLHKAKKLSPQAVIVACGCLTATPTDELNGSLQGVHLIKHRQTLAAALTKIVNASAAMPDSVSLQGCQNTDIKPKNTAKIKHKTKSGRNLLQLPQLTSFRGQTRAFLKVQDGCDGYCSYCVIPKVRPKVSSKPIEAVIQEAQVLVKAGHKEIVLVGIYLGAYGHATVRRQKWADRNRLAELLDAIAKIPGLERIRLSSLDANDVTEEMLDAFRRHRNIMPHLHLSLQSGSDEILRRMRRQYTVDEFRRAVESIKSRLDRPAITADIIVGFPGETDANFCQTIELVKEVGFAKMHVFRFSARKGTAAARMQVFVDNGVVKERAEILRNLDKQLGRKFREQFVGERAQVLVEQGDNGGWGGLSERYFKVHIENGDGRSCTDMVQGRVRRNDLVSAQVVENTEDGVVGELVSS